MKSWKKNLLALGLGVLLILLLEASLWIVKFQRPVCESDPYVTFKESVPVLVEAQYTGETWMALNPRLRPYFNQAAFPKEKAPGARRIFVLGESSTLGFPFGDQGSYAYFLKLGLNQLDPGRTYQVINLGAFGFASYRILRVFKEVLHYQPDLIIVMTGQNEFLEKREYGASKTALFLQQKFSRFKIYCLLKTIVLKINPVQKRRLLSADVKWEKMSADPKTRAQALEHFRYNLEQMVRLASEQKVPLLFLTAPSNLKDFPPYHSLHRQDLAGPDREKWQGDFDRAQNLVSENQCREAIPVLENLVKLDGEYAENWYLLGRCDFEQGDYEGARAAFTSALEKDAWQVRALPEFNEAVLELGSEKAWVLDLAKIFDEQSPGGIPGDNLFFDHCHPRLEAQGMIAREIMARLEQLKWLGLPEDWQPFYEDTVKSYRDSLTPAFFSSAYYNLAVEIGVNMGLKDLGKKYLRLGLELAPEDPKLLQLSKTLK